MSGNLIRERARIWKKNNQERRNRLSLWKLREKRKPLNYPNLFSIEETRSTNCSWYRPIRIYNFSTRSIRSWQKKKKKRKKERKKNNIGQAVIALPILGYRHISRYKVSVEIVANNESRAKWNFISFLVLYRSSICPSPSYSNEEGQYHPEHGSIVSKY